MRGKSNRGEGCVMKICGARKGFSGFGFTKSRALFYYFLGMTCPKPFRSVVIIVQDSIELSYLN